MLVLGSLVLGPGLFVWPSGVGLQSPSQLGLARYNVLGPPPKMPKKCDFGHFSVHKIYQKAKISGKKNRKMLFWDQKGQSEPSPPPMFKVGNASQPEPWIPSLHKTLLEPPSAAYRLKR